MKRQKQKQCFGRRCVREALRRRRCLPISEHLHFWRLPLLNPCQDKNSLNWWYDIWSWRIYVEGKRELAMLFKLWSDAIVHGLQIAWTCAARIAGHSERTNVRVGVIDWTPPSRFLSSSCSTVQQESTLLCCVVTTTNKLILLQFPICHYYQEIIICCWVCPRALDTRATSSVTV